jgi:hypothetical protein
VRACATTIQEAEGTTEQAQQQDVIAKEKLLQEEEDPRSKGLHKKEDDARSAAAFTISKVPSRYKKRHKKEEGQEMWSPREVVLQILTLNHWDDIDGILNHWMGRFNRKNFPPLIAVSSISLCLCLCVSVSKPSVCLSVCLSTFYYILGMLNQFCKIKRRRQLHFMLLG